MDGKRWGLRTWRVAVGILPVALGIAAGCRSSGDAQQDLTPRPIPGEKIVRDGSHNGSLLLYDGHLVSQLKDREEVESTVDRLTPEGTYSVLVNDEKKRIFNVDSVARLKKSLGDIEALQGPFADDVTFTVRSPSGHEGTVQGEKALFEFFEGKLPEGRQTTGQPLNVQPLK
jgi:hypothetical protein